MTKQVEKKTCSHCDSEFKLIFSLDSTNGFPKFCPFCGSDCYDEEPEQEEEYE